MITKAFTLSIEKLDELLEKYPNDGKSSHIGGIAVAIVQEYFKINYPGSSIKPGTNGADIIVTIEGKETPYEVKGTQDTGLGFTKLKVSSSKSYEALKSGMEMIRVTNIRKQEVTLHFLKCGVDFELVQEERWAVKKIRNK